MALRDRPYEYYEELEEASSKTHIWVTTDGKRLVGGPAKRAAATYVRKKWQFADYMEAVFAMWCNHARVKPEKVGAEEYEDFLTWAADYLLRPDAFDFRDGYDE